ncbi:Sigma factor binding protein 1 chloroplastic [Bienertia sinuspersici]
MSSVSQSPSFELYRTPPKLSNKQVLIKNNSNNNKPTKRLGKSRNKNNNINNKSTSFITQNNNKKQPLRVVHISNPMRFQVTAAEFRALVQGLTGRDAVVADDQHNFHGTHQEVKVGAAEANDDDANNDGSNDDKMLLHHDHEQEYQHQHEVNLSACFGPLSDHISFDCFNGDLLVMEDLQAFMDDDHHHHYY